MIDELAHALIGVNSHGRHPPNDSIDENCFVFDPQIEEVLLIHPRGNEDHAVDLLAEASDQPAFCVDVLTSIRDEYAHIPALGNLFDTSENWGEEWVRKVGHEDPDVAKFARDESTCRSVGVKLQRCRDLKHACAGLLAHP